MAIRLEACPRARSAVTKKSRRTADAGPDFERVPIDESPQVPRIVGLPIHGVLKHLELAALVGEGHER
jgi:hypothetical protein